jgi:ketosteroid isomerase-like protein
MTENRNAEVVTEFNRAFNALDVDAAMALMTPDVVFEGTSPPDGDRHVGAAAVRREWERLFAATEGLSFTTEALIDAGEHVVVRWIFNWTGASGAQGHIRGVDLFTFRNGLIAEKLSYVKG